MKEVFDMSAIDKSFTSYKNGEVVKATVVYNLKSMIIVNIGGKKDGYITKNDVEGNLDSIYAGQSFDVVIVNTKGEDGMIEVSKVRAEALARGNTIAATLDVGATAKVVITDCNNSGLISTLGEYGVFIPYSQISNRKVDNNLKNYINQQMNAIVIECDKENKKFIMSIRAFEEKEQVTIENAFWQAMFENKVVSGKVVRFTDFGAFVNVDGVDCLVHNSEVSYDKQVKAEDVLTLEKTYQFKVVKLDRENKKVGLSYKALQENPLKAKIAKYNVGDVVKGIVNKILSFGAILDIGDGVEGLLHIKEASQTFIKNIYEVAKVGQELEVKVIAVDTENLKISLSLKAMQEDPDVAKFLAEMNKED